MSDPNFQIKTEVEEKGFGRFIIEPLEQGYGQTLGNSLRRVLLASLPGCAITSVSIEGVKHQFSTLTGLKEDITELILNLKKVRLATEENEAVTLTLSKKGPGPVTAGDFEVPAGVVIVNPELVLGTLSDKKASLEITATAGRGYGYVQAEEKHLDTVGVIPVDALFSPIVRVNYRVEATRVGRMTNLDRLVMEIWTDATIAPVDALKSAAKVLVSYFLQVYEPKAEGIKESVAVTPTVSDEILKMRIEELDIPTRIVNALANGGIETIGQLLGAPRGELMKIKNLGIKSLGVVEEKLREKGVALTV
ncbi:DNA-directed RNA polymerase subunit alpha [Candidatus Gottesmanbacteria bacterium RIFCSPLOWO2_01_FULL_48_11]|uniref:DNA-directed RNA polymerase subunit alpha n=3 Tax=Candidatus Gottesmaniibacteriota TaxID=1752720 RepID=A0A0G1XNB4_9BACT|nr:MAG: DNA-directed RNA polymerase subunit alpha [Candidatus Gottesmanbacteria bacterium GW2011_GWA2_47_9]KKU95820.1 MAG: DNA-directed RNA polymerase subunit alpha [Candidatus Gottesmanbacteria bacterium GW2011_GWA1_48_13]OGG28440.1 MAG: DNA-directed RNA polymerase subunit alpha [Candidatus Gottesmanbacteria bacterium RIFCSPLOWO2_01_FULL_48_11]